MALITCPDCGKQISDQANTCIHCGRPMPVKHNLIISGDYGGGALCYYIYDLNGTLFDTIHSKEKKFYNINKPIALKVCHKQGSMIGCVVKDSKPVYVNPKEFTCLRVSITPRLFNREYLLTPIDYTP